MFGSEFNIQCQRHALTMQKLPVHRIESSYSPYMQYDIYIYLLSWHLPSNTGRYRMDLSSAVQDSCCSQKPTVKADMPKGLRPFSCVRHCGKGLQSGHPRKLRSVFVQYTSKAQGWKGWTQILTINFLISNTSTAYFWCSEVVCGQCPSCTTPSKSHTSNKGKTWL